MAEADETIDMLDPIHDATIISDYCMNLAGKRYCKMQEKR